jgi:hydrogenase maturation protein HypF
VFTSGNFSETPIVTDDQVAELSLYPVVDSLLTYNREIHNRVDDSVITIVNHTKRLLRRSRGFVPNPVNLKMDSNTILATGAELANCFAIGKKKQAILSQHIGDLKNMETFSFYKETVERFCELFRIQPSLIACDKHPDYLSTRYAKESGNPIIEVQHHHAHIASCMAENGIDEQVIGIALDGTGYGDDDTIWGGEFLVADFHNYKRCKHFEAIPIPGGDAAIKEPWRTALSYLYATYGEEMEYLPIPFLASIPPDTIEWVKTAIVKNINSPLSSSAGRLFDAVAAITGICVNSTFHAEPPMRLEAIAEQAISDAYPYHSEQTIISFQPTIMEIVEDLECGIEPSVISAKFQQTICEVIIDTATEIHQTTGIKKIALSGGTFQNRFLLEQTENELQKAGFNVYSHHHVPTNDGGIALGQLAIAAKRR